MANSSQKIETAAVDLFIPHSLFFTIIYLFIGMNKGTADHLAAWDLMDRILSSGLHVARLKTENLFRLFYPKPRDLNVT